MSSQYFLGRTFINSFSVCSGVLVLTQPSIFEILWTWVSTAIAGILKALTKTRFADFLPIPGREIRAVRNLGTRPPKSLINFSDNFLRCFALVL